jgi:hypothetical protein
MNLSSEYSVGSLTVEMAWISIGPWPPPRLSGSCEKSKRVDTDEEASIRLRSRQ